MKAYLILEDGNVFEGESVGANKEVVSEFVFNTSIPTPFQVPQAASSLPMQDNLLS